MSALLLDLPPRVWKVAASLDAEFGEMPGMRLTEAQVKRLCNLSAVECPAVLEHLVGAGRLFRDASGRYTRMTSTT